MPTPLRLARRWRGLSVRALAARAGINPSTIVRLEHAAHPTQATPSTVKAIAEALELHPSEIAEFADGGSHDEASDTADEASEPRPD